MPRSGRAPGARRRGRPRRGRSGTGRGRSRPPRRRGCSRTARCRRSRTRRRRASRGSRGGRPARRAPCSRRPLPLELGGVPLGLAEQRDPEPRDGDVRLDLVLLEEHPLEDPSAVERVGGNVLGAVAEVPEDRVRLGEVPAVVELQRRHAERRVLAAEDLRPVRAVEHVDLDPLVRDPEQGEQEPHLVAVARVLGVVEPQSQGRRWQRSKPGSAGREPKAACGVRSLTAGAPGTRAGRSG